VASFATALDISLDMSLGSFIADFGSLLGDPLQALAAVPSHARTSSGLTPAAAPQNGQVVEQVGTLREPRQGRRRLTASDHDLDWLPRRSFLAILDGPRFETARAVRERRRVEIPGRKHRLIKPVRANHSFFKPNRKPWPSGG